MRCRKMRQKTEDKKKVIKTTREAMFVSREAELRQQKWEMIERKRKSVHTEMIC